MSVERNVEIVGGVPEGGIPEVAGLYWSAFGRKLRPALGSKEHGVPFLASQLNSDRFFCAVADGRVIGVVGYALDGRSAVGFSYRDLRAWYSSASAPWRAVLIAVLGRRSRPEELLLDGLSVAPSMRGAGVGRMLLERAIEFAHDRELSEVRLSVVDSNPRARALYERLGFVEAETVSIAPFGALYGFRRSTDMIYSLG
ncbi:GNAT family N-acetyltransferase [Paeniglutamicibacter kerguelensis]|uniref:Ribosomal protein S18 acetylase RimI-like enzyme n=1 Tax=Paeniglutamicibacter kerguelensis TaxID=254788 RepID=A0ABS4XC79_9MICC|nr:GNAT family N-acetyltransferase [Paeniglutamicibacter kerguelensis]MBP2385886.1 ribosomal protein S18 acetylase RimI-like enzyme [Paeniglutamicibacter kerguelensis]